MRKRGAQLTCADIPWEKMVSVGNSCLCMQLQRATRIVSRSFDDALRPVGLSSGQFSLLITLSLTQPARIGAVAALLGMDRTTLTALLKPLERRGLVDVATDSEDRRGRVLTLTQSGGSMLAAALPIWEEAHVRLRQRLDEAGSRALQSGLCALSKVS